MPAASNSQYLLPDLTYTNMANHASIEYLKDSFEIEEGVMEFAPRLGFRKQFASVQELRTYIEQKFNLSNSSIQIKTVQPQSGKPYYIVNISGVAQFELLPR